MLNINEIFTGQRVNVEGDEGTIVAIQDCDFFTATAPSVHTQEKVFTVHFDDQSICQFRGQADIDEYEIVAI